MLDPILPLILAVAPEAAVAASEAPSSSSVLLAGISVLSTLGLAWIGYLTQKSSKQVKANSEAIADVQSTANATERKVTSNHGRDNLGDKVDELVDQVGNVGSLMTRVVDIVMAQDARIERIESAATSAAGQSADNAVIAASSFADLESKLDGLTVVIPPARILPIEEPTPGHPRLSQQHCRKANCDRRCGRIHD